MAENLQALLGENPGIQQYFESLPEGVKSSVENSSSDIQTLEDILRLVQQLTGSC